jgi:hypothetical protein
MPNAVKKSMKSLQTFSFPTTLRRDMLQRTYAFNALYVRTASNGHLNLKRFGESGVDEMKMKYVEPYP